MNHQVTPHEPEEALVSSVDEIFQSQWGVNAVVIAEIAAKLHSHNRFSLYASCANALRFKF
jgi:hypothetical protein